MPIISKSDKLDDPSKKESVSERFVESFGDIFNIIEPKFVSSLKLQEAHELEKLASKNSTKEERDSLEKRIDTLFVESGLHAVANDLVNKANPDITISRKIKDISSDVLKIGEEVRKLAVKESHFWSKQLKDDFGWSEDDIHSQLTSVKDSLLKWAKRESEDFSKQFESALQERILGTLRTNKFDSRLQIKINDTIRKTSHELLIPRIDKWTQHITEQYKTSIDFLNIELGKTDSPIPIFDAIGAQLRTNMLVLLDALKNAGPQTILSGGFGALLLSMSGFPFIGPICMFIGAAFLAYALIPLIPALMDANKDRREEAEREVSRTIKRWLDDYKIQSEIYIKLEKAVNEVFVDCCNKISPKISELLKCKNEAESVSKEISDLSNKLMMNIGV